jgi:hypothetical protein
MTDHKLKLKETFSRQEKHILRPGDRLSLKCVACGTPLPTITWNLDAFPIPETHRIQYGDYVRYVGISSFPIHSPSFSSLLPPPPSPTPSRSAHTNVMLCHPDLCDKHANSGRSETLIARMMSTIFRVSLSWERIGIAGIRVLRAIPHLPIDHRRTAKDFRTGCN